MNNKKNPLIFSKDDIFSSDETINNENLNSTKKQEIQENEEESDNSSSDYTDIFTFENFCLEYQFKTRESSLYKKISNDEYELLHDVSYEKDGLKTSTFCSTDSVYHLASFYKDNREYVKRLDYIPKNIFIKFIDKFESKSKNPLYRTLSDLYMIKYISGNFTRMIIDGHSYMDEYNRDLFDEYRKIFIKYEAASYLIPASNILESVTSDIEQYISNGEIDFSNLQKSLSELENFKNACPNSISLLSSFLSNPSIDYAKKICNSLKHNLNNIDNLMLIYFGNEIEEEEKEETEKEGEELC